MLGLADLHRKMLGVYFAVLGPRAAYALSAWLARRLYRLLPPLRTRSTAQCRAALGTSMAAADVPRIAEQAFVHRVWNLTDLLLAHRFLHSGNYQNYGGRIPEPHLTDLFAVQARGQPTILLTAYYGPFDLLPVFLGFNGVHAAAVYLPHANAHFDAFRRGIRARSGCELVPIERAPTRLPEILAAGGTIALVADHHAERRGLPGTFLGLPTCVPKTVGLLAWRYDADVVVAGIRRTQKPFHFEIDVIEVFKSEQWATQPDPVSYITARYLRGLEQLIRRDPTQYLWAQTRWGAELARQLESAPDVPEPAATS